MSDKSYDKLFTDFPPVSSEAWKEKITTDLKGADYEKKLVWKTQEGFNVQPYYRAENTEGKPLADVLPGEFPFVRGGKIDNNDWFIQQDIVVKDLKATNKKALEILMKGITSLGLKLEEGVVSKVEDLEVLFEGIALDAIKLNITPDCYSADFAKLFVAYIEKKGIDKSKVNACLNVAPLNCLTLCGNFCEPEEVCNDRLKNNFEAIGNDLPNVNIINISGEVFQNSGSSLVQAVACSLSAASDYLAKAETAGVDAAKVAKSIQFTFAVGGNYFMEIAKFRAAKVLWANIVKAYGIDDAEAQQMCIHAVTTDWNKTIYDPYVNMLRTTTESMSAALGGIDSLTVQPFDTCFRTPNAFSERIARNQQILLKEESHLDKITDPAAGSYYIETLTDSMIDSAWALFTEIEDKGGYVEAFKAGFIQDAIEAAATTKLNNYATRRENLLGTNQFPNFAEGVSNDIDMSVVAPEIKVSSNPIAKPLKPFRGAKEFEDLRLKTEKSGKKPKAYMLTIGNLGMRKARAQFACNFFACAGFEVVDNNGFETVAEGVKAAMEAKSDIIVLCSSDDEYETFAFEANEAIGDKAILVVAGYPKAILEKLEAAGINNLVHVRTNVLEALKGYQTQLGI